MQILNRNDVFPQCDIGAPSPSVVANEHVVTLSYHTEDYAICSVVFDHCFQFMMGMPAEDLVYRHPLAAHGLAAYAAHEVLRSTWIAELEARYGVITDYQRDGRRYAHYIFTFHDRSFECVASGFRVDVRLASAESDA